MMSAAAMTQGPRMVVTDIETRLKVRYSADTIEALQRKYPGVRFVWIMGGDNLLSFHRWRNWRRIVERVPVAIVARSAGASRSRAAPAFARYLKARKNETQAAKLPLLPAPAWLYLPVRLDPTSSTSLRARGR
jgi:nicotinate-nucleotide adenylyltransferase